MDPLLRFIACSMITSKISVHLIPCLMVFLAAKNACCKVVPNKFSIGERDRLKQSLTHDEIHTTLMSMKNGKFLGLDDNRRGLYNSMWYCIGEDFYCLAIEVFSSSFLFENLN